MSERSLGGTRFTRNTRSAFRDGLVSSNGRVALIGLLAALATLAFAVWLKVDSRRQANLRIPLAGAATRLDAAIPSTIALLQGWILTGEDNYRKLRQRVWQDEVIPALAAVEAAATHARDQSLRRQVDDLAFELRRMEVDQAWLEEITRAEGNVPASLVLSDEANPIADSISAGTEALIRLEARGFTPKLLLDLADYRGQVLSARSGALAFMERATPTERYRIEKQLKALETLGEALKTQRPKSREDALDVYDLALGELPAFLAALRTAIEMRSQPGFSIGLSYRQEVQPRFARIRAATSSLARAQGQAMVAAARTANVGTTIIVLLALLVGALSAGGLYYSIRLEHRMHQIASKAQMLGQYAIEAPLGGGGMGDVYRARHALLRRPTAIKLLRRGAALDPRAQARFREEVQLTSQLTHPNTIQVFDYGRTPEGVLYYAMELLEGVDLDALVRRTGPLPPERVVSILTQVCGSLAEAHALGLLHRDLKPSNVMLTRRGGQWDVAKVLDFGLAARMGAEGAADGLVGTPSYMAPEIIDDPNAASVRSDLYAVGCMGYFLLTGSPVFPAEDVESILAQQREAVPVRPSERVGRALPESLEAVLLGCLAKAPEDRPVSAQRLEALFEASMTTTWTRKEAEAWWRDFGEVLHAESQADAAAVVAPETSA